MRSSCVTNLNSSTENMSTISFMIELYLYQASQNYMACIDKITSFLPSVHTVLTKMYLNGDKSPICHAELFSIISTKY